MAPRGVWVHFAQDCPREGTLEWVLFLWNLVKTATSILPSEEARTPTHTHAIFDALIFAEALLTGWNPELFPT